MTWTPLEGRRARHDYAEQRNWYDPLNDLTKKPLREPRPDTAAHIASINGTLTPETTREVWKRYPELRPEIAAYAASRKTGWAA